MKWIESTNLHQWADRQDARARLPELIRQLVHATATDIQEIDFPAGDASQRRGWDGIVNAASGNEYVPAGLSLWELGCGADPGAKAETDYVKRTADPGGRDRATATYVFVTPRRWDGKEKWVQEKRDQKEWLDVRAYDASDLEQWLEHAPAVGAWLAPLVGTWPADGVVDGDTYWEEWASDMAPPTPEALVLADRGAAQQKLLDWLHGTPSSLMIHADSSEESVAFFLGTVRELAAPERQQVAARLVLVRDEGSWRRIVATKHALVLVPLFTPVLGISTALKKGHRVLVATGPTAPRQEGSIELPPLDKYTAARVLKEAGIAEDEAMMVTRQAGDSLVALRRLRSPLAGVATPPWAEASVGPGLVPALLAGAWDGANPADQGVLEALAQEPYNAFEARLGRWASTDAPCLRRSGSAWWWVSRADAWQFLATYMTSATLERFEAAAQHVLGVENPKYRLDPDERWLAAMRGATVPQSQLLRDGVAHAIAALGGHEASERIADGIRAPVRAGRLVSGLLLRQTWQRWASLSDVLPLLAEAAPDAFLEAVEAGLAGHEPELLGIFSEGKNVLFGTSPHTGLLWALEGLAWSPQYLTRVTLILGTLARLDRGGKLGNRPEASLRTIHLPWIPRTRAGVTARIAALDRLIDKEPAAAWPLLLSILPQPGGDSSGGIHKPEWRDWHIGVPGPTHREYWDVVGQVADRVLRMLGSSAERWSEILDRHLACVPDSHVEQLVAQLEAVADKAVDPAARLKIWTEARGAIHTHRRFANSEWALPASAVDRMRSVYRALEPASVVDRVAWLFSGNPQLPDLEPLVLNAGDHSQYEEERRAVTDAQLAAARDVLSAGALEHDVTVLLTSVENAYVLGFYLGQCTLGDEDEQTLLRLGLTHDRERHAFLRGLVGGRFAGGGWAWAQARLVVRPNGDLTDHDVGHCARGLPFDPAAWQLVAALGEPGQRAYWSGVDPWLSPDGNAEEAAGRLLAADRPYAALDVIASHRGNGAAPVASELIVAALKAAAKRHPDAEPPSWRSANRGYWIQEIFGALEKRGDVAEVELAGLEWTYLPILASVGSHQKPRLLHRELARDPAFFVEVLKTIYRKEGTEALEASEDQAARAHHGYNLLQSWKGIPGQGEPGFDAQALECWVTEARQLAAAAGRRTVGEHTIGEVLSRLPADATDGVWPPIIVREILERASSPELEMGVHMGRVNSRGVVTRAFAAGGGAERSMAAHYREHAELVAAAWPRTAGLLRELADYYESHARREDIEASLNKAKF